MALMCIPAHGNGDLTLGDPSPKNNSMPSAGDGNRMRRSGMGATSYLLLAAQILSLGHLLLVRHRTCSEHGDVIHSGQPHEELPAPPIAEGDLASGQPIVGAASRAAGDHHHCLICTVTRERFALLPSASTGAESIELTVALVPSSDASPFAPVAVIVLSPKNSPPAG
jgi:hypothetical protein